MTLISLNASHISNTEVAEFSQREGKKMGDESWVGIEKKERIERGKVR